MSPAPAIDDDQASGSHFSDNAYRDAAVTDDENIDKEDSPAPEDDGGSRDPRGEVEG